MANKAYRNKPTRTKRTHTRKEKRDNLREVPSYVWADLQHRSNEFFKAEYPAPKGWEKVINTLVPKK
jgi:hypothetical protein